MALIQIVLVFAWLALVVFYPERSKKTGQSNAKWAVVLGGALLVAAFVILL